MGSDHSAIGMLGLGLLGSAIAERLISHGIVVRGFDPDSARRASFTDQGGQPVEYAAEIVRRCDTVLLSLPGSATVAALCDELRPHFRAAQRVIDTSTGDPTEMVAIGATLAAAGVDYIEAMVAGSSSQVRAGQVVLFVGGPNDVVANVAPLLAAITPNHFHLGSVGTASRFKLVHNLLLGLHRAVLAEGLTFADSLGFDPAETLRILRQTPAASVVMETKGTRMVRGDFTAQARLSQHLKDVRLILAEAERHGARTPLSLLHESLLEQAEQLGFGDHDNSAIIEAFRAPVQKDRES